MIYFDNSATTKPYPEALETYMQVASKIIGNPSSLHRLGDQATRILDASRKQIADLIGKKSDEIYFTSGGTEGDNWVIKGVAFEKIIATIGSILGLITASITIMNFIDNKSNKKEPTTTQTTVIKENQIETPTNNTIPDKNNNVTKKQTQQDETPQSKVKEEKTVNNQDTSNANVIKETNDSGAKPNTSNSENKSNQ